jgi:hypothetical protein
VPQCRQTSTAAHGVCKGHWRRIPEDIQARWQWAVEDGDAVDRSAAMSAILEDLSL